MKNNNNRGNEGGQAVIMIVFAIVGLIALTALTVDGGNIYSNRRQAQNAADTAALAGARAKVRQESWKDAALAIASVNGFTDEFSDDTFSGDHVNVEVYQCNESGVNCNITLQAGDALQNYIQVKITSEIDTYFGGLIGVWQVTNRVNSVVRVKEGAHQPIGEGSALFSLNPSGCASVSYQGSAAVTLIGSGIYVNSSCINSAFFNQSSNPDNKLTAPCLQAVGGIQYAEGSIVIPNECILSSQLPLPPPTLPQPTCADNAVVSGNTLSPGNWSGAFPPSGVTNLQPGVYCVSADNQNFSLNANQVLTGQDVTIYMISGGVTWNGQATVRLDAPDSGPFKGLLLYLPPANSKPVSINGGGDSQIEGTILAPASECNVLGGGGQEGLQAQLICYDIKLGGGSNTTIVYDAALQYNPPSPPTIELTK